MNHWGKMGFRWVYWNLLLTGEDPIEQDVEAAMVWLTRSADGGNTRAKEFLVDAYNHGKYGIRKSPEKAEYWKSR